MIFCIDSFGEFGNVHLCARRGVNSADSESSAVEAALSGEAVQCKQYYQRRHCTASSNSTAYAALLPCILLLIVHCVASHHCLHRTAASESTASTALLPLTVLLTLH